ncbi:MAG: hypothetical protein LBJ67_02840 [Planctomycetaceae bacterium]|jgi:Mrp family chromosome partitioning ATPase|nr:hypothetical protein [Planctomycetaceae bacterium]
MGRYENNKRQSNAFVLLQDNASAVSSEKMQIAERAISSEKQTLPLDNAIWVSTGNHSENSPQTASNKKTERLLKLHVISESEREEQNSIRNPALQQSVVHHEKTTLAPNLTTTFYKNDTRGFLGELREAKDSLFDRNLSFSKIDFPSPKKKQLPKDVIQEKDTNTFDSLLSDDVSDEKFTIKHLYTKKEKEVATEPEKTIIDVADFVETFSVIRPPDYLKQCDKRQARQTEDYSEQYEIFLNQTAFKKELADVQTTIDRVAETVSQDVLNDISVLMENQAEICEHDFNDYADDAIDETRTEQPPRFEAIELEKEEATAETTSYAIPSATREEEAEPLEVTEISVANIDSAIAFTANEDATKIHATNEITVEGNDSEQTSPIAVSKKTEQMKVIEHATPEKTIVDETRKTIDEPHEEIAEQYCEQRQHRNIERRQDNLPTKESLTELRIVHAIHEAGEIVTAKQAILERAADIVKESMDISSIAEKEETSANDNPQLHATIEEHNVEEDKVVDNQREESDMNTNASVRTEMFRRKFPSIVKQLEGLATEQCDLLAEYIRDKVYHGRRLIAFCGMRRQVGCSTMALIAAKTITRYGLKTALIDANFDYPHLESFCPQGQLSKDQSDESCWVDVLQGKGNWETLGFSPENNELLTIFPLRENVLASWTKYQLEFLQQAANRFITAIHEHFDLILLDCGAFESSCEEITWGELELLQPDGVILVRNPNQTSAEEFEPFYNEMTVGGIEEIGIAENFV